MSDHSDALDNAANAALWMLSLQKDPRTEHMGALFQQGENLGRTADTVDGSGSHVHGKLTLGGPAAALFHNHPTTGRRDSIGEQFSDDDRAQARRLSVPSYISTPSNALRKYDPSTNTTSDVLAEFPIDENRAYLMQKLLGRSPDDPRGLYK
ncbi:MAG: hypothetical protein ABI640_21875 [Gammaproteobacteria bacterium]